MVDVLLEGLGLRGPHHALDGPHREGRVGRDLPGQLGGGRTQLGVGHHPVDQAQLVGLLGQQRATGEGDLGRLRVAHHAGQQPRAPALGEDAALGEARVELGRLAGDAEVAAEGDVEAVARGTTVERAHRRRVEVVEHDRRGIAEVELAGVGVEGAEASERPLGAAHLGLEVEAGAEGPAGAGEHDHAHLAVAVGLQQVLGQRLQHRARDRVHPLGGVERDGRDVVGDFVEDFGHRRRLGGHCRRVTRA